MLEHGKNSSPIKSPQQLIAIVAAAFVVPIVLIVLISQLVTSVPVGSGDDAQVLARIAPVGTFEIAAPSLPKGNLTGDEVYTQVCKTCHDAGIAGAHKLGDKAAWAKVIRQGEKLTVQHAIAGWRAMPPRGGKADLTDAEVQRGVAWMVNKSGGSWKEAALTAADTKGAVAFAAAAPVLAAAVIAGGPAKADGKKVYDSACVACHGTGIAGAPKFGDKAAWTLRTAQGANTLHERAIQGYQGKGGVMPPKGGNTALSDAEVKAAVDYMVAAAK